MLAARLIKPKKDEDIEKRAEPIGSGEPLRIKGDGMIESHEEEPLTNRNDAPQAEKTSKDSWFYAKIDGAYTWLLRFSMARRWVIVTICALVFISIIPLFMFVGKNFLPVDDQSQFEVSVRAPEGYSLQASTVLMERIATDIRKFAGVTDTLITIGGGQQQVVNSGSVYVKLSEISDRSKSQEQLMADARELLKNYPPELRTAVQQVAAFSGGGFRNANVQYLIGGPDLKVLEEVSQKILEKMKTIPDAVDVDSTLIAGKPEVQLVVDRDTAADLGVKIGDVSQALNVLVAGQEATNFNEGTDQYEVRVRALGNFRNDIEGLKKMVVPSTKIGLVSLDRLIKVQIGNRTKFG